MAKIEHSIRIAASPDRVWAVVGDLSAVTKWIPGVVEAKVDNFKRICVLANGVGEIHEEISGFSVENRWYRFAHSQTPMPVRDSRGGIAVEADGDGSKVTMRCEFEPLDPASGAELTAMMDGAYKQTLETLRGLFE